MFSVDATSAIVGLSLGPLLLQQIIWGFGRASLSEPFLTLISQFVLYLPETLLPHQLQGQRALRGGAQSGQHHQAGENPLVGEGDPLPPGTSRGPLLRATLISQVLLPGAFPGPSSKPALGPGPRLPVVGSLCRGKWAWGWSDQREEAPRPMWQLSAISPVPTAEGPGQPTGAAVSVGLGESQCH